MASPQLSIVYVWDADYPWDVRTEKVCRALTDAGHRVTIVARNKMRAPKHEVLPEGTVYRMSPWRWAGRGLDNALGFPAFFNPRWARLIRNAVKASQANLIIVRDLPLCPTAVAVGRHESVPVLLDMAENYPAMMRALWETGRETLIDYAVRNPAITAWIERRCVRAVDHVVVVVEESAERVMRMGVPQQKITIVSNTPPLDRLVSAKREVRVRHSSLDLVYMGNLEVVRGLLETVEAVGHLKDAGTNVHLRVIGRGRDEALIRDRCAQLGLDDSDIEFLGYIASHAEALRIVADSNVGLIPHRKNDSWDTTIPNKLFDYMAAGVPVVSSDAAPCARIVLETGAGRVFKSGDAQGMAAAILEVSLPGRGATFGSAGRQAVTEKYNWEYDTKILLRAVDETAKAAGAN
jgi:glycosyltransferase involved in cell wall biosynthesis